MNPSKKQLKNKLIELEDITNIDEFDIAEELKKIIDNSIEENPCLEYRYEVLAFSFMETRADSVGGWGTYFGPMMTWETEDGTLVESPSIQFIDEKTIRYWEKRALITNNPILKARYSGLVWDFSTHATSEKAHYSYAEICCKSLFDIAEGNHHKYAGNVIRKIDRALSLAITLNNPDLIEKGKNVTLRYENRISEDSKPGLWGFSYDLLVGNSKVGLPDKEELEIITDLEEKLNILSESDPWVSEKAAERLIQYYNSQGKHEDRNRVIRVLGKSFESSVSGKVPLVASSLLDHIHSIYSQYNLSSDAERVSIAIKELGPKVIDDMKEVSHEFQVPMEEIDNYVNQIVDGDLIEVLRKIAFWFVPHKDKIQDQIKDLAKRAPLSFHINKQITDNDGRVVAVIGPLSEDLDGHIVNQMSQNISFSQLFLSTVFDRAIDTFEIDAEKLIQYLLECPVIEENQSPFLLEGLQLYFDENYIASIHILIPQIEQIARNLIVLTGGSILKRRHEGGFYFISLDEMLRNNHLVKSLGDDIAFYLRVVLTDQRGWNLRNNICHGLSSADLYTKSVVERIIQIFLLLAQLRNQKT